MADILLPQIKDVITNRAGRIRHDVNVHRAAEIVGMLRYASELFRIKGMVIPDTVGERRTTVPTC